MDLSPSLPPRERLRHRKQVIDWWLRLAREIASRRPELDTEALEIAARDQLQRLIFASLCESRGLSGRTAEAELSSDLRLPGQDARLCESLRDVCRTIRSELDDRLLAAGSGDPPIELLGAIHQQLLAVRLINESHPLQAAGSPAGRKGSGVFYTPRFVADYIVDNTLGRRLDARPSSPPSGNLRLIDPACGCGSFLISACRRHWSWSLARRLPSAALTTARLIHGVDLDREAIAVARRSLWLELRPAIRSAEEEAELAAVLRANVHCGDVLLDNRYDGRSEFDFVVGNPPYRRELNSKDLFDRVLAGSLGRFRSARMDYWHYFVHRGLELLKSEGRLAFIVNSYWTGSRGAEKLIAALRQAARIDELLLFGNARVFDGVAGRHMILSLTRGPRDEPVTVKRPRPGLEVDAETVLADSTCLEVYRKGPDELFRDGRIDLEPVDGALLAKFDAGTPLGRLGRVRQGIAENPASVTASANTRHGGRWTVGEGVFALTPDELARLELPVAERQLLRPYHDLCDLDRYFIAEQPSLRLIYSTEETWPDLDRHPRLAAHLSRFRPIMEERRETRAGHRPWWRLHWPRDESLWESDKIVALQMARRPAFVPSTGAVYVPFSVNVFVPDANLAEHLHYFAAVLNSRLLWDWFRRHAKRRGVGLEINGRVLARAPVRRIDFSNTLEAERHEEIVELVSRLLDLNRVIRNGAAAGPDRATRSEAEEIDRRIDEIVDQLYSRASDRT